MRATDLKKIWPQLQSEVALAPLTTFHIGGPAKFFLDIKDKYQLVEVVRKARVNKIPYLVFAEGSNMVFPDRLPPKLIIRYTAPPRMGRTLLTEGEKVSAEAGVPLMSLVRFSITAGLSGLESLSGIPGTVGGAIFGNAGAYGQTVSDHLQEIEIYDGRETRWIPATKELFSYRNSIFKKNDWLILSGKWRLQKGDTKELTKKSREIIRIRNKKYPLGIKCPGSYFKNIIATDLPKKTLKLIPVEKIIGGKVPAGYLLEVAGVKGLKKGKIMVPDYHGNLILNTGGGQAADVLALGALMKKKVKDRFNIILEEEVLIIT
jgi:UDP-N-acetylmuramate dehydrogenase